MKKLFRSKSEKMIAGVCGGLASYFSLDPTLVRIALVGVTLLGGSGLIFYLAMWIIVPIESGYREVQ
ncbi:MAG: PspC domain-containing protein [Chloroherpetonaceae bacterium]|nr:PspC domain-containing protein [Chloroherpetonaceae bacterium]